MTEKEYRSLYAINNSAIGWFLKSPKYCKAMLNNEIKETSKKYFEWGTKVHMRLLEPEEFKKTYVYLSVDKPKSSNQLDFCADYIKSKAKTHQNKAIEAFKLNYSTTGLSEDKLSEKAIKTAENMMPYIEYLKLLKDGQEAINPQEAKTLKEIIQEIEFHKLANNLIMNNANLEEYNEFAIVSEELINCNEFGSLETKLPIKGKIDKLLIDRKNRIVKLIDLKTSYNVYEFDTKSFINFDYLRQIAFYKNLVLKEFPETAQFEWEFYIVAIQSTPLIEVKVFKIASENVDTRLKEIKETILPEIAWHWEKDNWKFPRKYYDTEKWYEEIECE